MIKLRSASNNERHCELCLLPKMMINLSLTAVFGPPPASGSPIKELTLFPVPAASSETSSGERTRVIYHCHVAMH